MATPPHSLTAPAARSHSGLCSTIQPAPWWPPASSSARRREEHVAAEAGDRVAGRVAPGRARLGGEEPDHAELERDHVLHVDRATSVDVAVGDPPVERVVRPSVEWRRHHVEVRQQEERFAARPVTPQPGVHGAAARDRLDDLGAQPGVLQGAPAM